MRWVDRVRRALRQDAVVSTHFHGGLAGEGVADERQPGGRTRQDPVMSIQALARNWSSGRSQRR